MRWLRTCQQRESESEPEKSKMKLTEFGRRAESKRQERAPPAVQVKRQQKVSNIHTQSKHQTSSNTEWDTLIFLAPQEASIFRKSSKCKLIYYRKSSWGAGVQPNSRHQRVKPKLCSSAHRDSSALVSKSQLWAMHVGPPTNSQTNTHDRILHYSWVDYWTHVESVCVSVSAHHYWQCKKKKKKNCFSSAGFISSRGFFLSIENLEVLATRGV